MFQIFKDGLIEIRKRFPQFISIALIIMLGVGFLVGIRVSGYDMRLTGDDYFNKYNLMDFRLISTLGFDDESLEMVKDTGLFKEVEPAYVLDVFARVGEDDKNVKIYSYDLNDNISRFELLAGVMPSSNNQILVDVLYDKIGLIAIGDIITIDSEDLNNHTFEVVGFIRSPIYINLDRGFSSIGNGESTGFMYLMVDNFNLEAYTEIVGTFVYEGSYFDSSYSKAINKIKSSLDNSLLAIKETRLVAVKGPYEEDLLEAQSKLAKAEKDYTKGIADGEKQLADALKSIKNGQVKLLGGYNAILKGLGLSEISQQNNNVATYNLFLSQAKPTIDGSLAYLNSQLVGLDPSSEQYLMIMGQINQLKGVVAQYPTLLKSAKSLDKGYISYQKGMQTLADKRIEGKIKLADAKKQLKDAQIELDKITLPNIYVQTRNNNPGYSGLKDDSQRIEAIGQLLPLIFFLVAALVCLSSISRMIDEQRQEIGTYKALGYSVGAISTKYLMFAGLSTIIGIILGLYIGFDFLPVNIFKAYNSVYNLPGLIHPFTWSYVYFPVALTILVGPVLAFLAVFNYLRSVPATLMRPLAAPVGKRVLLERVSFIWKRLGFLQKITIRNIFRNKLRMGMIILGIAGCSGLLVVGFGLNHSVMSIQSMQFNNISVYTGRVAYEEKDELKYQELMDIIDSNVNVETYQSIFSKEIDASDGNLVYAAFLDIYPDNQKIGSFINLQERITKDPVVLGDQGVVIDEKLASLLKVKVGDSFEVFDRDNNLTMHVKISGIVENYVSHYIYMSRSYYASLTNFILNDNTIMFNLKDNSEVVQEKFSTLLMEDEQVLAVTFISTIKNTFDNMMGSFQNVIYIVIAASALLAFIVLYNLGNMNINERKRELATIQVLGFNNKETNRYIDRESLLLCLIGIVVGMIFGKYLHNFVITTVEMDMVMFNRVILWTSYAYSIILSLLFFYLVNIVLHRMIKKIELVSALKSVE